MNLDRIPGPGPCWERAPPLLCYITFSQIPDLIGQQGCVGNSNLYIASNSLVPRPHPQEGKGSGDFGRNTRFVDYVTDPIQNGWNVITACLVHYVDRDRFQEPRGLLFLVLGIAISCVLCHKLTVAGKRNIFYPGNGEHRRFFVKFVSLGYQWPVGQDRLYRGVARGGTGGI